MAGRIKKIRKLLQRRGDVQESASCARALAGMAGNTTFNELIEVANMSQALLTAKVILQQGTIPWPMGISRQLDPEDPAFLPPLGAQLPLFARESTMMGVPGQRGLGVVDPWGWCGPEDGPMITVWFADDNGCYCAGKLPSHGGEIYANQQLSENGHGVLTSSEQGSLRLEVFHWPVTLDGKTAWSMVARVVALADCKARLAFVLRPVDLEGSHPIFNLTRSNEGEWSVNGKRFLALSKSGHRTIHSSYGEPDIWKVFQSNFSGDYAGSIDVRCVAGLASGAEVYEQSLSKGETLSRFVILCPPKNMPSQLVRMSEESLWKGAIADFKGINTAGARLDIGRHQSIMIRAQQRLMIGEASLGLAGCLGAVALARMGFIRLAGERLGNWLQEFQSKDLDSDTEAILVWAAAEYVLWSGERSWLREHKKSWIKLLDNLSKGKIESGGHEIFGPAGSLRWTEIWRIAALLNGVRALRGVTPECQRWGIAGAGAQEGLLAFLGKAPWSSAPNQAPDGSSAALLAAGWLRLIPLDTPELLTTEKFLTNHMMHDGGVMLHGGTHIASTSILLAMQKRSEPSKDVVSVIARYASNTGALPSVRHKHRGALLQGDDQLAAALFALLVLDDVQVKKGKITLHGLIRQARDLPTPFGKIDITDGRVESKDNIDIIYRQ
jgi:hypothetical protein